MPSNIVVPEVGESIVDARVARWLRKAGDIVAIGDPLVELETDKIDVEVAAPQAGVLARIDRQDGEDVKIGEVLGIVDAATSAAAPAPVPPSDAAARAAQAAGGGGGGQLGGGATVGSKARPTAPGRSVERRRHG